MLMRIVLNRQPLLGTRTGIGHYTAELLAALQSQAGEDEIHVYPTGWMWRLHARLSGPGPAAGSAPGQRPGRRLLPGLGWLGRLAAVPAVRGALRTFQPLKFRHFQGVCRREQYDLYHEPN